MLTMQDISLNITWFCNLLKLDFLFEDTAYVILFIIFYFKLQCFIILQVWRIPYKATKKGTNYFLKRKTFAMVVYIEFQNSLLTKGILCIFYKFIYMRFYTFERNDKRNGNFLQKTMSGAIWLFIQNIKYIIFSKIY